MFFPHTLNTSENADFCYIKCKSENEEKHLHVFFCTPKNSFMIPFQFQEFPLTIKLTIPLFSPLIENV